MTNRSGEISALIEDLRRECDDDYVGLWQIAPLHRSADMPFTAITDLIGEVAAGLLAHPEIVFGQFRDYVFEPWPGDPESHLARILTELEQLGHAPSIGEIGWFMRV